MKTIPPFKLKPIAQSAAAAALKPFKLASAVVGTRHQLGGTPQFLQAAEWPSCRSCCSDMSFYGQLDSINDDYCIADCGIVYVFVCFDCNETYSLIQSG